MEEAREFLQEGVLTHLDMLETQAYKLARHQHEVQQQQSRVEELRATVERLRAHRDQLRARGQTSRSLQQLTEMLNHGNEDCDEEEEEDRSQSFEVHQSLLTVRKTHVKDLLSAHHILGGYDMKETRSGRGVCFSLATAYEGLFLETYNLEIDLTRPLRIFRHNIPPFIPLEQLAQRSLQTDVLCFLGALSQHLNAYAGRSHQAKHIQERLGDTVVVMERNGLCNLLTVMVTEKAEKEVAVLITLEYSDLTRFLPSQVTIDSEDKQLAATERWAENRLLFLNTPAHEALLALKKKERIL
ncbi:centromere protein O [Amia ocellicauda]|uniref:centromere protein O n=1 Tax=Amia ocellicauda TaxID=2972642 RepID=UPI00346417DB